MCSCFDSLNIDIRYVLLLSFYMLIDNYNFKYYQIEVCNKYLLKQMIINSAFL